MSGPIPFDNRYVGLGATFHARVDPEPVAAPRLVAFNRELAAELGMAVAVLDGPTGAAIFSGNEIPPGAEPLAMAYAGHQFGGFSPRLGDGRAILLGEVVAAGQRHDVQLKGSGPTPFSRNGDGRAALGPVIREYLLSEAMARLGVPTTRALALVATGETVMRDRPLPGGILTRISRSFVRVGSFEYFAANGDWAAVRRLADHVIGRLYPEVEAAANPYEALLGRVVDRQAALIARWMQLGFIHGVMNTDNVSIAGETIDYGPCAFMDGFDHHQVYSSIDRQGRYAYANQPPIGQWNLIRFAETLLPLLRSDGDIKAAVATAQKHLNTYIDLYRGYWLDGMREKLGLLRKMPGDDELAGAFLDLLARENTDFTLAFRRLSTLAAAPSSADEALTGLFHRREGIERWLSRWRQRLARESRSDERRQRAMRMVNPLYIPRNHQVEAVIHAAEAHDDFAPFHRLHAVLQHPFDEQPGCAVYAEPPKPDEVVWQTFCGT